MSIPTPQVQVFQDFTTVASEITEPLRPFIFGPEYALHRYTQASEKGSGTAYDPNAGNVLTWEALDQAVGSVVDQTYTQLFVESGLLEYYPGNTGSTLVTGQIVAGTKNKVKLNVNAKDNGSTYPLNALFSGRDVQLGDQIRLSGVVGTRLTEDFHVADIEATQTASVIAAASQDASNQTVNLAASNPATATAVANTGATGITVTTAGTYNGVASGYLTERYIIECVRGTTGTDITTALFNITTSSGTDNQYNVVMPGSAIALGTRGSTWVILTGVSVPRGAKWTLDVATAYNAVTMTSNAADGDVYTGAKDDTYVLVCVQGGTIANDDLAPIFKVTTANGTETGANIQIKVANTNYDVGLNGVKVKAATGTTKIAKGQKWYIGVTARKDGNFNIVVLDRSVSTSMATLTSAGTIDQVTLFIEKDLELPSILTTGTYLVNWSVDETGYTVNAGAKAYDSTWKSGTEALPLKSGQLFAHWRELILDHANQIGALASLSDLDDEFATPIDPDNPLVYALNKCLLNSNGTGVRYMAVASDDLAGYQEVLNKAEVRDDVYSFVPLTQDKTIQDQVAGHVSEFSSPENGLWRIAFFCPQIDNPKGIVTELSNGNPVQANASKSGNDYLLELTSTAIADGISYEDVNIGDFVRLNYASGTGGVVTYQSIKVKSKVSNTILVLASAPDPLLNVAQKIEIWRVLDADGLATEVSTKCGVFANRRVRAIYPDTFESGGVSVSGIHMCAALAGIRGGVVPHQGLTNLTITGFDNADKVVKVFNREQIEDMTGNGVWLIRHDLKNGSVYTHMAVTTDTTDVNTREDMVTSNVDSISYAFSRGLARYIGRANVTPSLIDILQTEMLGLISSLKSSGFTGTLGGQLIDAQIAEIRPHEVLKDSVVARINLQIPYALNYLMVHLVI